MRRSWTLALAALLLAIASWTALGAGAATPAADAKPAAGCRATAPRHVTLTLSPRSVSVGILRWRAPRNAPRDVSYRVQRNRVVVGQTRHRGIRVRVTPGRSYRFTVRAVRGSHVQRKCAASIRLTVTTAAPPAPSGLTASAVTDTSVMLQWQASRPQRGTIRGYRILRDGSPVRQVDATATTITNLFPSRDYTFSVVAIDSLGHESRAATVQAHTADPAPASGGVHAFLLASTGQSFRDFQAHYRQIGTVYPTYFDCDPSSATITGKDNPQITEFAKARHVAVLARFNCQRTAVLHRILGDPALRAQWLDGITAMVSQYGYDGAALDFEAGAADDRDLYTSFVADLAARLHADGKRVTVVASAKLKDVPRHPRSTFFDYINLSQVADHIFVMAWGIHWATSAPGAQDDMTWIQKVVAYIDTMPDPSKFILGMQLYGMDWPTPMAPDREAAAYEYAQVQNIIAQTGATPVWDPTQDAMHLAYTGPDGRPHDLWYTEAHTQSRRIALAAQHGLGVGLWRLGNEDQRLWDDPQIVPAR
jgi:spore germination protein YaaH